MNQVSHHKCSITSPIASKFVHSVRSGYIRRGGASPQGGTLKISFSLSPDPDPSLQSEGEVKYVSHHSLGTIWILLSPSIGTEHGRHAIAFCVGKHAASIIGHRHDSVARTGRAQCCCCCYVAHVSQRNNDALWISVLPR